VSGSPPASFEPSRWLSSLPGGYIIATLQAHRQRLERAGVDVIDLSIGEPDLPPPDQAVAAVAAAAAAGGFNRYPPFRGVAELRQGFADFYHRHYGVRLDPERQVLPVLGTKEALVHLVRATADAERPVYLPRVAYPAYRSAAALADAPIVDLPGEWEDGYLPALPAEGPRGGALLIASPNNPTGAVLPAATVDALVAAARARRIAVCFDAAYVELRGSQEVALPLRSCGADGVIELHSMSKTFALAGWRIGFAVGDPALVDALARIKSFIDAGVPLLVQRAAAALLPACDGYVVALREHFLARQRALRAALDGTGLELFDTDAAMFCWVRLAGHDGAALTAALVEEGVLAVPGGSFGAAGAACVRLSVAVGDDRLQELRGRVLRAVGRLRG
jgi:aspartate/methionine/tyrosine aminotransferase